MRYFIEVRKAVSFDWMDIVPRGKIHGFILNFERTLCSQKIESWWEFGEFSPLGDIDCKKCLAILEKQGRVES